MDVGIDIGTASVRAVCGRRRAERGIRRTVDKADSRKITQNGDEVWRAVGEVVREVAQGVEVASVMVAATCSMVVEGPAGWSLTEVPGETIVLWMDHRAELEARELTERFGQSERGRAVLATVAGGFIPAMGLPKLKWMVGAVPEDEVAGLRFVELHEHVGYRMLGGVGGCDEALADSSTVDGALDGGISGWSREVLELAGIPRTVNTRPRFQCGQVLGSMCAEVARAWGLANRPTVRYGTVDSYAGMLLCLASTGSRAQETLTVVAGTSSCYSIATTRQCPVPGMWGPYAGVLDGLYVYLGGLLCTGSLVEHLLETHPAAAQAGRAAAKAGVTVPQYLTLRVQDMACPHAAAAGVVVYGDYQGNRTPYGDGSLRGMTMGESLDVSLDNLVVRFIAIMEWWSVAVQLTVETLGKAGISALRLAVVGSQSQNAVFCRMLALLSGCEVVVGSGDAKTAVARGMAGLTAPDQPPAAPPTVYRPTAPARVFVAKQAVVYEMVEAQQRWRAMVDGSRPHG